MKKKITFALWFLTFLCIAAALAWVGGYNFNERGPGIAMMSYVAVAASVGLAMALTDWHSP